MGVEIKLDEEPIPIGIGVGGTIDVCNSSSQVLRS
jgi:hypothetical protein